MSPVPLCSAPVRLAGGSTTGEGRVEVYDSSRGIWGQVSNNGWDVPSGRVLCRQLGFRDISSVGGSYGESQSPYILATVKCEGTEGTLTSCPHSPFGTYNWDSAASVECQVDGAWGSWSEWNRCSVSCGAGFKNRTRKCDYPAPLGDGKDCDGIATQEMPCIMPICSIDGEFSPWSAWGRCTVSCEGGIQTRSRKCSGGRFGGSDCEGPSEEFQNCNGQPCPVNGYFKQWSDWSECSASCGSGNQTRQRICVAPQFGGRNCSGENFEQKNCTLIECPVDGVWDEWTAWSQCDVTCGPGEETRNRTCVEPLYGGTDCDGNSTETRACDAGACLTHGQWLEWGAWSGCTVTCDGGRQRRTRLCSGDVCDTGSDTDLGSTCNSNPCNYRTSTCAELKQAGLTESCMAQIYPSVEADVWVYCDVDDEDGVTVIGHDNEAAINVTKREFTDGLDIEVTYNLTQQSILAIMSQSEFCRQHIRWQCRSAPIFNPRKPYDEPFVYWNNNDGASRFYWGGVKNTKNYMCACGESGSCADKTMKCNCDSNDDVTREDEGYVTEKEDLPIASVHIRASGQFLPFPINIHTFRVYLNKIVRATEQVFHLGI
ncbi:hypothetical protein NP493_723g02011 [Ridgeia piscesae]|uniref:SRCR domain-containing protein n=1 Tax=Ridgeia piscesae TaxID=27915 RepID=A0AAD9KQ79_RIDPI|nr:hypothetical protein NP493_723g02011 [Ridgeia piscesae]